MRAMSLLMCIPSLVLLVLLPDMPKRNSRSSSRLFFKSFVRSVSFFFCSSIAFILLSGYYLNSDGQLSSTLTKGFARYVVRDTVYFEEDSPRHCLDIIALRVALSFTHAY